MVVEITIPIEPKTKKNSQRIVKAGNYYRILPSKAFEQYQKDCKYFIPAKHIGNPVNVCATYYMGSKRRVDLTNLHEALHDILVNYGCLEDDNSQIIVSTDGSRVLYDHDNPRTEITITDIKP